MVSGGIVEAIAPTKSFAKTKQARLSAKNMAVVLSIFIVFKLF